MRKSYGNTYWGRQWLNAFNNISDTNRLPRGKTYANKGTVSDIEISGNKITAKVQGRQRRPYRIAITIPAFDANEKAKVLNIVTSNPLYLSQLLNRELPSELNDACRRAGVNIFPRSWRDLEASCSCPDWALPCKHLAATLYLIANEIDKNPFQLFELHDFDLFKGLEGIGYSVQGQKEVYIPSVEDLWQPMENEAASATEWEAYEHLDFTQIPDCKDTLLTILGEQPVFFPDGNFKEILAKAYSKVAKASAKLAKTATDKEEADRLFELTEEIEVVVDESLDFVKMTARSSKGKRLFSTDKEEDLVNWLERIPAGNLATFSPALRGIYLVYRFAAKLAEQSAFIPQLLHLGTKHYLVRWLPALLNEKVRAVFETMEKLVPGDLFFTKTAKEFEAPVEKEKLQGLVSFFLNFFLRAFHGLNYRYLDKEVVALFFEGQVLRFREFETKEYPAAIQLWLNRFYLVEKEFVPLLKVDDLEDAFELEVFVEERQQPMAAPVPLKEVFDKDAFRKVRLEVLRDLAMLATHFPGMARVISTKGTEKLRFDPREFVEVLFKMLPTIRLFGIRVVLPKALRKLLRPQLSLSLETAEDVRVKLTSIISLENILRFNWQIAIGDKMVNRAEFLKLVNQLSGIVKWQDDYVYFDENEIKKLVDKLENPPALNPHELLQMALTEDYKGAKVKLGKRVQQLMKKLLRGEGAELPAGLLATLRPYQLRGYEWLYKNARLGFGSIIADDMGLGKTLQVICTLLKFKEQGELNGKKALAIVPTTLLTNWDKEIKKFAPSLKTLIYHGPNRKLETGDIDLVLTSYGVARSDTTKLNKEKWLSLIIDEAQNIKNPNTGQSKAIKKMKAPVKIAMSGTPVENRLTEYWSIFDFVNKGYLGGLKHFKDNFAAPIEIDRDHRKLTKFKKITAPFILRRLKSDKSIIKDLPEKIEQDQFCQLTKEQAALYQSVVTNTMKDIESKEEGIQRKGLILKLIIALKQVCNHPAHFLKKGSTDPALSGKSVLLLDLLQRIVANGEKSLIFTQYREMGDLLIKMFLQEMQLEVPFLHGGLSRKRRDEMVEDFQNDRSVKVFILSLKAGGTGLNLTAASNVIHYDLWWNPAVEAQATDRAYRIGQKQNVMVHRFITQNTFEEKINKLLQSKKELADLAVSTGEKWIGEMSNKELQELVKLE